jgi:hypothetical protein
MLGYYFEAVIRRERDSALAIFISSKMPFKSDGDQREIRAALWEMLEDL